jgi:hypothetical protein
VKASVVRQPKKVYCETIGMGAKPITIVRAVTTDFFLEETDGLMDWHSLPFKGPLRSSAQQMSFHSHYNDNNTDSERTTLCEILSLHVCMPDTGATLLITELVSVYAWLQTNGTIVWPLA